MKVSGWIWGTPQSASQHWGDGDRTPRDLRSVLTAQLTQDQLGSPAQDPVLGREIGIWVQIYRISLAWTVKVETNLYWFSRLVNTRGFHAIQEIYVLKLGEVQFLAIGKLGFYFCSSFYFFMVKNFKLGQ